MPGTEHDADLALLVNAARAGGDIARSYFCKDPKVWDKDDNAGPVTEADLAVNAHLLDQLRGARADYGWLSEETEDHADRLGADQVFVVDPIDGTRAFINGTRDWSISTAIATAGVITAAAVYVPMRDMMFAARLGGGATLNDIPIKVAQNRDVGMATVLAAKPNFAPHYWRDETVPAFARAFRSSLAYRLCLVAQGRFDAMLTLRPTWEWDIAAGTLIVSEAGGNASTQFGGQLAFNNPTPQIDGLLAAGALHAPILNQLKPMVS